MQKNVRTDRQSTKKIRPSAKDIEILQEDIEDNRDAIADNKESIEKGLNFKGDKGVNINKKLGGTLTIKGEDGKDIKETASKNILVDNDNEGLVVKLSKKLQNLESADFKTDKGNTTVNGEGLTVKGNNGKDAVSLKNNEDGTPTLEFSKDDNN